MASFRQSCSQKKPSPLPSTDQSLPSWWRAAIRSAGSSERRRSKSSGSAAGSKRTRLAASVAASMKCFMLPAAVALGPGVGGGQRLVLAGLFLEGLEAGHLFLVDQLVDELLDGGELLALLRRDEGDG